MLEQLFAARPRAERRHRNVVGISAHVENPKVIAAATETPRGQAAVCNVSSPDADPTYPTRLSIDGCCRR
jgi:hypothetical protein